MISRLLLAGILAFGCAACANAPNLINDDYALDESVISKDEYRKRLEDWFNCDECVNGQLRRLQELGNRAVPDLAEARDGTMIQVDGADLALADDDAVLLARCTRTSVTDVPGGDTAALTVDQCVERFKDNRDRRYRGRAGIGLLAIRTRAACTALGVDPNGNPVCEVFPPFEAPGFIPRTGRSTRSIVR